MKHLTYLLLLAAFSQLSAQLPYTPFFLNNAEWTMEKVYPTVGPYDNTDYWRIYTTTDTVINDISYRQIAIKKLCRYLYANAQETVISSFTHNNFPIGALRESDQKVYFYKYPVPLEWLTGGFESTLNTLANEQEHLLYDFSAMPGDTVWCSNGQFTIFNEILSPVEGLNHYKVTPRNTFIFPHETGAWLEGIGSSYGLFGSYDSYLHYLICFKQNGAPLAFSGNCSPCGTVGVAEEDIDNAVVTAFPNPVKDRVQFRSGTHNRILAVQLWSVEGRSLQQKNWSEGQEWVEIEMPISLGKNPVLAQLNLEKGYQTIWLMR